jgi:hypothetical protein
MEWLVVLELIFNFVSSLLFVFLFSSFFSLLFRFPFFTFLSSIFQFDSSTLHFIFREIPELLLLLSYKIFPLS